MTILPCIIRTKALDGIFKIISVPGKEQPSGLPFKFSAEWSIMKVFHSIFGIHPVYFLLTTREWYTLHPVFKRGAWFLTSKVLYLTDVFAKRAYDNHKENGYYTKIIPGNISPQIKVDSIQVGIN